MRKFVLILATITWLFGGCAKQKETSPIPQNQLKMLDILPNKDEYLVYLNLAELRKTQYWDSFLDSSVMNTKTGLWLKSIQNTSNIPIVKSISEVYLCKTISGVNVVGILFDNNKASIKNHFEALKKLEHSTVLGNKIYSVENPKNIFFYFVNDSTLLLVDNISYVKNMASGKIKSAKSDKRLMNVIKSVSLKNHFWLVSEKSGFSVNLIEKVTAVHPTSSQKKLLRTVRNLSISASFGNQVKVESLWQMRSTKDAYLLSTGVKGALAMDLFSKFSYELDKIMKKLIVEQSESIIDYRITFNNNDLNTLKDFAKKKKLFNKL